MGDTRRNVYRRERGTLAECKVAYVRDAGTHLHRTESGATVKEGLGYAVNAFGQLDRRQRTAEERRAAYLLQSLSKLDRRKRLAGEKRVLTYLNNGGRYDDALQSGRTERCTTDILQPGRKSNGGEIIGTEKCSGLYRIDALRNGDRPWVLVVKRSSPSDVTRYVAPSWLTVAGMT